MFIKDPRYFIFLLAFLSVIIFSSPKPVIDVKVEVVSSKSLVLDQVALSNIYSEIIKSKTFEIALEKTLKNLFSELRLQDLFSSSDVILSKQEKIQGILKVSVTFEKFESKEQYFEYIKNEISGDYIKWYDQYIRIYPGQRYKMEYVSGKERYIPDSSGSYVRGYDGNYYSYYYNIFYSKIPHIDTIYELVAKVTYSLEINSKIVKTNWFTISSSIESVEHFYDPYNNKLLRTEKSLNYLAEKFAFALSKKIKEEFVGTLSGQMESVSFPRVLINIGDSDGVEVGDVFEVKENNKSIAQVRVVRTSKDYSECEVIYMAKDAQIKPTNEVFKKPPDFIFPMGITLHCNFSQLSLENSKIQFGITFKSLDLFREVVSFLELSYVINANDLILGNLENYSLQLSTYFRLFGAYNSGIYLFTSIDNESVKFGTLAKLGALFLSVSLPINDIQNINLGSLNIGGGFSW